MTKTVRTEPDPVIIPEYHSDLGDGPMTEEVQPTRATTVQEQGIGPRTPYPTGSPPDPDQAKKDHPVPNEGSQPVKDEESFT